jgi:hypothetical protein
MREAVRKRGEEAGSVPGPMDKAIGRVFEDEIPF